MIEGTHWFRRFYKDCKKISPHLRFVRVKLGFYRIYWKDAYIYECYKNMPPKGFEWFDIDPRLENREYYEEYEDQVELTRKIKNFVEGYADAIDRIRTRVWLMRNDKEYYERAKNAYKQMYVK